MSLRCRSYKRDSSNRLLVFDATNEAQPKKMKSMLLSPSWTIAPSSVDLTLGGAELKEIRILRILR